MGWTRHFNEPSSQGQVRPRVCWLLLLFLLRYRPVQYNVPDEFLDRVVHPDTPHTVTLFYSIVDVMFTL